jgi:hypothetical protein
MGRQAGDQSQFFYLFNLEERIPERHLLRRINPIVTRVLADLCPKLQPFYSEVSTRGRPAYTAISTVFHPGDTGRRQATSSASSRSTQDRTLIRLAEQTGFGPKHALYVHRY